MEQQMADGRTRLGRELKAQAFNSHVAEQEARAYEEWSKREQAVPTYEPNAPYPGEIAESMAWAKRIRESGTASTSEKLLAGALVEALTELKRVRQLLREQSI
jgi:hypothetical protein